LVSGQTVTATKNASFPLNNDNSARPGDTITYTIGIGNGAAAANSALNVQMADTIDSNSTFVSNSAKVSPNAIAHAYNAAGNTQLSINASNGLLNGVHDIDLVTADANLVVTAGTFATTSVPAGSVTIAADGSFLYTPATGNQNITDTFTYTVTDTDGLASTGRVSINLGARVWYIDSSNAGAQDGSSAKPFNSLADVSGATGPDTAGDIIFVRRNVASYDGGITLLNNEQLYGSGFTLVVNSITINTAGANTTLVTTGAGTNAITVASGNTIKGFTINSTTAYHIANTTTATVGSLTISSVTLGGSGGLFRADSGGTLAVTFDSAGTSGFSGTGIQLMNVGGTFTINGSGNISAVTGDDVLVSGGNATISIASSITNTAGHSVNVSGMTGGSATFSAAISDTGTGILLNSNTGATFSLAAG
jgi:uncharacterized repeat protein (TIGR01451 family)